jgi:hypothetical protein
VLVFSLAGFQRVGRRKNPFLTCQRSCCKALDIHQVVGEMLLQHKWDQKFRNSLCCNKKQHVTRENEDKKEEESIQQRDKDK